MVEHVLAKDDVGVRFPLPAPEEKIRLCVGFFLDQTFLSLLTIIFKALGIISITTGVLAITLLPTRSGRPAGVETSILFA